MNDFGYWTNGMRKTLEACFSGISSLNPSFLFIFPQPQALVFPQSLLGIIERKRLNKKEERKIPSSRKDQISSLIRIRVNKTRRETTRLCPAYKFGLTNLAGVMTSKRGWKMERVERSFIASPHKSAR